VGVVLAGILGVAALTALILWLAGPDARYMALGFAVLGLGIAFLWSIPLLARTIGPWLLVLFVIAGIIQAIIDL
jgi:hypothetical protein